MKNLIIIIYFERLNTSDYSFLKICKYLELSVELVNIKEKKSTLYEDNTKNIKLIAISGKSIIDIYKNEEESYIKTIIESKDINIYLYGLGPSEYLNSILKKVTNGKVLTVNRLTINEVKYEINSKYKKISRQLSGLKSNSIKKNREYYFEVDPSKNLVKKIIKINDKPFFISVKNNKNKIYLSANAEILDINKYIKNNLNVLKYFSGLVPTLMVLKYIFKNQCWNNNKYQACIIIDDPLLKLKHGFFNYSNILDLIKKYNFHISIAFIPWNYFRTQKKVRELIIKNEDKLSISIHGCDHTKNEFGNNRYSELNTKIKTSLKRMEKLKNKKNINYQKVMVAPYGSFTKEFLEVLQSKNFIANISTEIVPEDKTYLPRVIDLLKPTLLINGYCPIFIRRKLNEKMNYAFDLFIGKPLLIVTHHNDFKNNNEKIIKSVKFINKLDPMLHWTSLEEIIKKSYLTKIIDKKRYEFEIFAKSAQIKNSNNFRIHAKIFKKEKYCKHIKMIEVNNKRIEYNSNKDKIEINIDIKPKETINVEIIYFDFIKRPKTKIESKEKIKILFRRFLSEIRDNYIDKNEFLLKYYNRIVKSVGNY